LENPFVSMAPDVVTQALVKISHYADLPRLEEYPFFNHLPAITIITKER
jgi:hypothetical protein